MFARLVTMAVALAFLPGCSFLDGKPMPERLSEEAQARCDYGWEYFVANQPVVEHATLLDTMLMRQVWHRGVDRLYLRSEKQAGDVLVVMETRFERIRPDGDDFSVTLFDTSGRTLRAERFTRQEIEAAIELVGTPSVEDVLPDETPEEYEARMARLAELQARMQRVHEVFPLPPDPNDDDSNEAEPNEAQTNEAEPESE